MVCLRDRGANPSAVGARVSAWRGGRRQAREVRAGPGYISQADTRLHFGLGQADRADSLVVRWPDGVEVAYADVAANQLITIRRGEGVASVGAVR